MDFVLNQDSDLSYMISTHYIFTLLDSDFQIYFESNNNTKGKGAR